MSEMFGSVYAPAYDVLYRDKDYDDEIRLLRRIFRQYVKEPVRTVLDLGCGTGSHALRLVSSGLTVVGVDRSEEMLIEAKRKAKGQTGTVQFCRADIRNVNLGETFDAALMMFAVLGYQLENEDVRNALESARRHLRLGGVLVFDVWYGPGVLAQGPQERARTIENGGSTWVRSSSGRLDILRHLCQVDFRLQHVQGGKVVEQVEEFHTVRYFFPREIELFLDLCGFQLQRLGSFPEFDRDPDQSIWNAMAVAVAV